MKSLIKSIATAVLLFSVSGCAQLVAVSDALRPAAKVALQAAETATALSRIEQDYRSVRQSVIDNTHLFVESELDQLREGNDQIVIAHARFEQIKSGSGGASTVLVNTSELVGIAMPVRNSINAMITVMDQRIGDFDVNTQIQYVKARGDFVLIDTHIQRLIDESDARVKAQMVKNILRIAAQIIGVAKIAIEAKNASAL